MLIVFEFRVCANNCTHLGRWGTYLNFEYVPPVVFAFEYAPKKVMRIAFKATELLSARRTLVCHVSQHRLPPVESLDTPRNVPFEHHWQPLCARHATQAEWVPGRWWVSASGFRSARSPDSARALHTYVSPRSIARHTGGKKKYQPIMIRALVRRQACLAGRYIYI